ncbi:hypothetical protein F4W70_02335 [Pseudomonas cannabina]|uniref:hypothetical protein n=1 Tax=Pseudomonas cannabina TaxID=86840 RepID=UPI0011B05F6A|nr:hypothetical protein [Pseudomonas cannabina]KAA8718478.1 hypothetical protein F4W70_02335 [Pseudomonas cannabina]
MLGLSGDLPAQVTDDERRTARQIVGAGRRCFFTAAIKKYKAPGPRRNVISATSLNTIKITMSFKIIRLQDDLKDVCLNGLI